MEEEKQEEVVQFTYHESLNAAPLRKCGRKCVLGGLIEQPRLAILAALATNPGREPELGHPAKSPSPPRPLLILLLQHHVLSNCLLPLTRGRVATSDPSASP